MERRQRRSEHPHKAVGYYLDAAAARMGCDLITLADADGLLLASSDSALDDEAVAAVAPLYHDARVDVDGLLGLVTRGQGLSVAPVDVLGTPCFLATVGGAAPTDAQAAINRIFG